MARALRNAIALCLVLPACTAVLGLERAELDEGATGGSPGTGGGGTVPLAKRSLCEQLAPDCESCIAASCAADMAACVSDRDCRRALMDYALCLGQTCTDDEDVCLETVLAQNAAPAASALGFCVASSCKGECAAKALMPTCELYCQCMGRLCTTQYDDTFGSAFENCLTACEQLRTGDVSPYCRWDHCEFAIFDVEHCLHASGESEQCGVPPAQLCLSEKKDPGHPCSADEECCSNRCLTAVCR